MPTSTTVNYMSTFVPVAAAAAAGIVPIVE
jgi:hypothetical protein